MHAAGTVCVRDIHIDEQQTSPGFSAMLAVTMFVWDQGDCYSSTQISAWLSGVGVHLKKVVHDGFSMTVMGEKKV